MSINTEGASWPRHNVCGGPGDVTINTDAGSWPRHNACGGPGDVSINTDRDPTYASYMLCQLASGLCISPGTVHFPKRLAPRKPSSGLFTFQNVSGSENRSPAYATFSRRRPLFRGHHSDLWLVGDSFSTRHSCGREPPNYDAQVIFNTIRILSIIHGVRLMDRRSGTPRSC